MLALLGGYGGAVGEAFQLRDDLLGIFGSASVTGKPTGGDLSEHKATSVVVAAHQMADAAIRRQLDELMSCRRPRRRAIARWRALIVATGAVQWIEELIAERRHRRPRADPRHAAIDEAVRERCRHGSACAAVRHDACESGSGLMRTVGGRTDHVVVVGAGLAGLSAALHLAGRGRRGHRRRARRRARAAGSAGSTSAATGSTPGPPC